MITHLEMNHVSRCCHKEIIVGRGIKYPDGGRTWGIPYKYDCCSGCGLETDAVEACGICGVVGCVNQCEGGEEK